MLPSESRAWTTAVAARIAAEGPVPAFYRTWQGGAEVRCEAEIVEAYYVSPVDPARVRHDLVPGSLLVHLRTSIYDGPLVALGRSLTRGPGSTLHDGVAGTDGAWSLDLQPPGTVQGPWFTLVLGATRDDQVLVVPGEDDTLAWPSLPVPRGQDALAQVPALLAAHGLVPGETAPVFTAKTPYIDRDGFTRVCLVVATWDPGIQVQAESRATWVPVDTFLAQSRTPRVDAGILLAIAQSTVLAGIGDTDDDLAQANASPPARLPADPI